jgi:uncharacterized protein YbaR (Trm112 family)
MIGLSRMLSRLVEAIKPLKAISDSIYIKSIKHSRDNDSVDQNMEFLKAHRMNPLNNLNTVSLLRCPRSGAALQLSDDKSELISLEAGLAYPVHNQIPILVSSEARTL